jgi:hypothetical protein
LFASQTLDQADEEVFLPEVLVLVLEDEEVKSANDGSFDEEESYEETDEEEEEEEGEASADEAGRLGSPNPLRQWSDDDVDDDVPPASPIRRPASPAVAPKPARYQPAVSPIRTVGMEGRMKSHTDRPNAPPKTERLAGRGKRPPRTPPPMPRAKRPRPKVPEAEA